MNETIFEFFPPRLGVNARQDENGAHSSWWKKTAKKEFSSLHFYGDEREDAELKKKENYSEKHKRWKTVKKTLPKVNEINIFLLNEKFICVFRRPRPL